MHFSLITIRGLLSLLIIIPIIVGLKKYKTAGTDHRLFLYFLFIGLCTDIIVWIMLEFKITAYRTTIYNIYSLIEAAFFFWFINNTTYTNHLKSSAKISLILVPPYWILCIILLPKFFPNLLYLTALFDTSYEVLAAFLAGFALLQFAEKDRMMTQSPDFWFTIGIFFYCFCTFYIMAFLETRLQQRIWFINNIINIISYGFYAMGFYFISKKNI